jgi:predicted TIM-barrel fold metal-dependent hydrolase
MAAARGTQDAGFALLCRLLAEGRAWTKLSGADRNSGMGAPYADIDPFAAALLRANPERVVWGSDWPHINYFEAAQVPDDGALLNLLPRWIPDEALRRRVLADNPAQLYGFTPLP